MSFTNNRSSIEFGDTVIVYYGHDSIDHLIVTKNEIKQTRYGAIKHDGLVGHKFGHKFNTSKGWLHVLKPTPELWTLSLPHRTQILYSPDIAMITLQLDLKPGDIVCESGTGSASLSHAILRTISPNGYLHTTEFHEQRAETARLEFKDHGYEDCVTVHHGDVIENGFSCVGKADAVFLDIPKPWEAIKHAITAFKPQGGRFCSFSPCIEQVQKTCENLRESKFTEIKCTELVQRNHNIRKVLLPVADIGLTNPEMKQKFFENEDTSKILTCSYEEGEDVEVGELVGVNPKQHSKKRNIKSDKIEEIKKQKIENGHEKTDCQPAQHAGFTSPTSKALFSTRTFILPKQIYGHTGYLTFASYSPK